MGFHALFIAVLIVLFVTSTPSVVEIDEEKLRVKAAKTALEGLVNFYFTTGEYDPPVAGLSLEDLAKRHHDTSTYVCGNDLASSIMKYQYHTPQGESFNATKLLLSLRHRTLSIIGDSLGMQTFHGLDNEIHSVTEASFSEGGRGTSKKDKRWLDVIGGEEVAWLANGPRYKAARRYNHKFNATVYFCNDATLDGVISNDGNSKNQITYCAHQAISEAIETDGVLLLSIGAWYKPQYSADDVESSRNDLKWSVATKALREFLASVLDIRKHIASYSSGSKLQVIWRLISHAGPLHELDALFDGKRHGRSHKDGAAWDALALEAPPDDVPQGFSWTAQYNAVLQTVAKEHNDYILDSHRLSRHLLSYNAYPGMHNMTTLLASRGCDRGSGSATPCDTPTIPMPRERIHADSIHYCAGSVQRAEALVIQELVSFHQLGVSSA